MAASDPRAKASGWRGFKNYIYRPNDEDSTQYAPAINVSKILQLYVGPLKTRTEIRKMQAWTNGTPECWDNWIYKDINGITNCSNIVYLRSQNMSFSIDVKNKFADMSIQGVLDKMSSNLGNSKTGSILKAADGGLEFVYDIKNSRNNDDYMGALYIPKYTGIKGWEGMEPITYNYPTFEFSFGQYGLYNARREVVEPILAICSCFLPTQAKDKEGNDISYRWQGPIPTSRAQMISIFKSLLSSAAGEGLDALQDLGNEAIDAVSGISGVSDIGSAVGGAIDTAIKIKDGIYKAFDDANQALLRKSGNKLAYFRLGEGQFSAVMGPFYIESVKPEFDFSNTDLYGFPTKGTITFSGVTSPIIGSAKEMDIFGLGDYEDPVNPSPPKPSEAVDTK